MRFSFSAFLKLRRFKATLKMSVKFHRYKIYVTKEQSLIDFSVLISVICCLFMWLEYHNFPLLVLYFYHLFHLLYKEGFFMTMPSTNLITVTRSICAAVVPPSLNHLLGSYHDPEIPSDLFIPIVRPKHHCTIHTDMFQDCYIGLLPFILPVLPQQQHLIQ